MKWLFFALLAIGIYWLNAWLLELVPLGDWKRDPINFTTAALITCCIVIPWLRIADSMFDSKP